MFLRAKKKTKKTREDKKSLEGRKGTRKLTLWVIINVVNAKGSGKLPIFLSLTIKT